MKKIVVLSGVTASGRKSLLKMLEQSGFCCVAGIDFSNENDVNSALNFAKSTQRDIVFGICDNSDFEASSSFVKKVKAEFENVNVIFLECDAKKAAQRLKSMRIPHPFADAFDGDFTECSIHESKNAEKLRRLSDTVIDTTHLSLYELLANVRYDLCSKRTGVVVKSFGHKYGMVLDADFVIDVRCLPNPYWVEELKSKSGLDKEVSDFVFSNSDAQALYQSLFDMVKQLYSLYVKEGRVQFTVAVGCTGGRHRSVAFAQKLYTQLENEIDNVKIIHRDIDK